MHNRVLRRAVGIAACSVLLFTGIAFADVVTADGDLVTASSQSFVDFGTVPAGSVRGRQVGFVLECLNTMHVAQGTQITLSPVNPSAPPGGSITATATRIGPVPTTWPATGDACPDDLTVSSANPSFVTVTAPTVPGTYNYRIEYSKSPSTGVSGTTLMQFRLTVAGNHLPQVSVPGPMVPEANTVGGWTAAYSATAADVEDGSLPATCSPAPGSVLPLGPTTVTCTATDSAGGSGSATFRVTVVDTTAPAVSTPADMTTEADTLGGWTASYSAAASDVHDGPLPAACAPASGTLLPLGPTTVTCSATDGAGLTGSATFVVTVVDTTGPQLSGVPGDQSATTTGSGATVSGTDPAAADVHDGQVAVGCAPASGSAFPVGTTRVTCTATDASGNASSGGFDVTVTRRADLAVAWNAPIGSSTTIAANAGRTIPLKATITLNGRALNGSDPAPRVVLDQLDACGGNAVLRLDAGAMAWDGNLWRLQLDTSALGGGCWRLSVVADGQEAGTVQLDLGASGQTPTKSHQPDKTKTRP